MENLLSLAFEAPHAEKNHHRRYELRIAETGSTIGRSPSVMGSSDLPPSLRSRRWP
jgi:hypothetical protein